MVVNIILLYMVPKGVYPSITGTLLSYVYYVFINYLTKKGAAS